MSELVSGKGETFVKKFLADFANPQWNNDDDNNDDDNNKKKKTESLSDYFLDLASGSIVLACLDLYLSHHVHRKNEITLKL